MFIYPWLYSQCDIIFLIPQWLSIRLLAVCKSVLYSSFYIAIQHVTILLIFRRENSKVSNSEETLECTKYLWESSSFRKDHFTPIPFVLTAWVCVIVQQFARQ